jgi:methyl-accepting chemotaxis protein
MSVQKKLLISFFSITLLVIISGAIETSEKMNFNTLINLANNISSKLNKTNMNIDSQLKKSQKNIDSTVTASSTFIITFALIAIAASILIATYSSKNVINSLNAFQASLLDFFRFINKETDQIKMIKIK